MQLGIDKVEVTNPREQSYLALAVRSPADQAVDVSGWKVTAGSTTWSFPQGKMVIASIGRVCTREYCRVTASGIAELHRSMLLVTRATWDVIVLF